MNTPMTRRRALALGASGLGAALAGCGPGKPAGEGANRRTPPSTSTTSTTTAPPTTTTILPTAADLADRFGPGSGVGACTLTPQTIAGPSYLAVDAILSDLRDDRPGVPLTVGLRVLDPACSPVAGAAVELWGCDAAGLYSGYAQPGGDTTGLGFGRGTQVTDANGIVAFTTLYPGWYRTRAPHLHAKVLLSGTAALTTQLFLDDAVSAIVFAAPPYADHPGQDTVNATDSMFVPSTVLSLSPSDPFPGAAATGGWLGLLDLVTGIG